MRRQHPSLWLRRYRERPRATLRLVCFPHAGGNAAFFRGWSTGAPPGMEVLTVQYPGHGDRLGEPVADGLDDLGSAVAEEIQRWVRPPYAFFGHSLGAAVAFEVARRLEARGSRPLAALLVSGRLAPKQLGSMHLGTDDELWQEVLELGGTDAELGDRQEIRDLSLPVLRHDFKMSETYVPTPGPPLGCPIRFYHGADDPETRPLPQSIEWANWTSHELTSRQFAGDHFYLVPQEAELLRDIATVLGVQPTHAALSGP